MTPVASLPERPMLGRRELIAIIATTMSMNALAIDSMLPALDDIARDLGAVDGNRRQLVIGVYTIAMGIGSILPGSFADRFGRRRVLLFALAAYSSLALVASLSRDFSTLLAARALVGILAAGLIVVPAAIIRDLYEGDEMARLMSMISAVFITVPVLAPSLGQGILVFASWRWIFASMAIISGLLAVWIWFRLPETLPPENRQAIHPMVIATNMRTALTTRSSIGYVFGTALVLGAMFGYVNSAQQLYSESLGVAPATFPLLFGITAAAMGAASFINSKIVMRFGARRVSHTGVMIFILVSAVQVWSSYVHPGDIYWFVALTGINFALLGFLMANFGSIAMQPFATIAGAASSIQTVIRMLGASLVGVTIGQAYDGTAQPFAWSLLILSLIALLLVTFSERGKLFTPPRPNRPRTSLPGIRGEP